MVTHNVDNLFAYQILPLRKSSNRGIRMNRREKRRRNLEDLLRSEADRAYWAAYRSTGSKSAAEDIMQEAFVKILANPPEDYGPHSTRVYLLKVVHGTAANYLQAKNVRKKQEQNYQSARRRSVPPEESIVQTETARRLRKLVGGLPQDEREVMSLRFEQELTLKEAAEVLSVPIQTVATRARRGLNRLRRRMEAHGLSAVSGTALISMLSSLGVPPAPISSSLLAATSGKLVASSAGAGAAKISSIPLAGSVSVLLVATVVAGVMHIQPNEVPPEEIASFVAKDEAVEVLPPGLVFNDAFKKSKLDPFWENVEAADQIQLGTHPNGLVKMEVGGAHLQPDRKSRAGITSKLIPLGGCPLEIQVARGGSRSGASSVRGLEVLNEEGKRLLFAGKVGNFGEINIDGVPAAISSTSGFSGYKVVLHPNGKVWIKDKHYVLNQWLHSFERPVKRVRLCLFADSKNNSSMTTSFGRITVRRLKSWPAEAEKCIPRKEKIVYQEDFKGEVGSQPTGGGWKFLVAENFPALVASQKPFSGDAPKVKEVEWNSPVIDFSKWKKRSRKISLTFAAGKPIRNGYGKTAYGYEIRDERGGILGVIQFRGTIHFRNNIQTELIWGADRKVIHSCGQVQPHSLEFHRSGKVLFRMKDGHEHSFTNSGRIQKVSIRAFARVEGFNGSLTWPIDQVAVLRN